jgi:hypothetical protein
MKKLFATFLLLATTAGAATISGTVSGSSGALTSMTVAAYTTAGALQTSSSTGASGAYSLTVPAGSYHVLAYDPAGVFATSFYAGAESFETSSTLPITSSQNITNINFVLPRAGYIVGRVTTTSGAALANMTVAAYNLSGTRRGFTRTDANGNYSLSLAPGSFKIAGYDDALKYATTFFSDVASFNAASVVSIEATTSATANLQLPLAADVAGTVTDRVSGMSLGGIRATAYAADGNIAGRALTGSDGKFAFAVRPGSIRVVFDDPSGTYATLYAPDEESFSVEPVMNVSAGSTTIMNGALVRGAHITGHVIDRTSGAPLSAMTAAAYNADGTLRAFATTDVAGAYSIVVPPGDYRVSAFDDALVYLAQFYPSVAHAVTTVSGFDFALTKGAHVSGTVTAVSSGSPLAHITIGVYDFSGRLLDSTSTDAAGRYTIFRAPGTIKLLAFDPALQFATAYYGGAVSFAASTPLPLIEGASLTADFALAPAGRVNGNVMDAASTAPLANMQVIAYDAGFNEVAETATDINGMFRLALAPGTYTIAAADITARYAGAAYAQPVTIAAGLDTGPIQIRLFAPPSAPPRHRAVRH